MIQLFQSYDFKQSLSMAYISNLEALISSKQEMGQLVDLGVQVLTNQPMVIQIFTDPNLVAIINQTFEHLVSEMIEDPLKKQTSHKLQMFCLNLDYIAKPDVLRVISKETLFLDKLIQAMAAFQFQDACDLPDAHQSFDEDTIRILHLINMECNILSRLMRYVELV